MVVNYERTKNRKITIWQERRRQILEMIISTKKATPLNVDILNLQPNVPDAAKIFKLWKLKFEIYSGALEATEDKKFNLLINRMDLSAYEFIDTTSYAEAMAKLEKDF